MKTIFKTLLLAVGTLSSALAQTAPESAPTGFIRVVNGVSQGTGQVNLWIDGSDMRPQGYKLGDATGGIGLRGRCAPAARPSGCSRLRSWEGCRGLGMAWSDEAGHGMV